MTDLSEFGGGVDHDPGPEDGVRLDISSWLRSDDVQVYWDRDHGHGWGTFDVTQQARFDLVVDGVSNTYAVEVKVGDDSGKIHDGFAQLVRYWRGYVDDEYKVLLNGTPVNVDAFLIATKNSPHGRIYQAKGEGDVLRTGTSGGRQKAVAAGQLPNREFNATERAIRVTWRLTKEQRPDATCGIGALLSSRLDGDDGGADHAYPAALYKSHGGRTPDGWDSPGYQWWEYIPFYLDGGAGR